MANSSDFERVVTRLLSKRDALKVDSSDVLALMTRIGISITTMAKQNVTRLRVVDTGRLLNSLGYAVTVDGDTIKTTVGTSNIRYGRMQEFGGTYGPAQMRAMFAALRARGLDKRGGKHIMVGNRLPPRPYLQPAFEAVTRDAQRLLGEFFKGINK